MDAVNVEGLTREYGNGKGIFQISFSIKRGEAFGFLGPNGAGKTTTIRHLMGFLKPAAGQCTIEGMDCWKERSKIQEKTGYIPGEISFFDDMTGAEFLCFQEHYRKMKTAGRKKELLDMFELDPRSKIRKMSKGMKQKLGIVSAMMHDPEILILDEPTSGLDPLMQKRFTEFLAGEKNRGKTILLSSHMFEEVERTCDRIGIIRNGKLAEVDSVQSLRKRHVHPYKVTLATEELAKAFARDFEGTVNGKEVTVAKRQSLEEIFMQYYGGEQDKSDIV